MKKIFTLFLLIAATICLHAQNEVILRLDHQLDGKAFALNQEAVSPSGSKYKLTRLQFYLSGIRIWHDGNQEMALPQFYFLVDPSKSTSRELSLGVLNNVSNIEKIEFAIGVDAASNHLDPASYPASHALAPKNPTMHWGWTSGYRFITLEGKVARSNGLFLDDLAIHTVGDQNFKLKSYVMGGKPDQGKLYIDMKAEYNLLLDGIIIAGGQNNHGETGSAAIMCINGSTKVFQPASPTATKEVFENAFTQVIYDLASPVIRYRFEGIHSLDFQLYNLQGRQLRKDELAAHEGDIQIDKPLVSGHYYYLFSDGHRILSTGKVLIR